MVGRFATARFGALVVVLVAAGPVQAEVAPGRHLGMDVRGDDNAEKVMVILPWRDAAPVERYAVLKNPFARVKIGALDPRELRLELRLQDHLDVSQP